MEIGTNPLPMEVQQKLSEFIDWLDKSYDIDNGATAFYWGLSYQLATVIKEKDLSNGK